MTSDEIKEELKGINEELNGLIDKLGDDSNEGTDEERAAFEAVEARSKELTSRKTELEGMLEQMKSKATLKQQLRSQIAIGTVGTTKIDLEKENEVEERHYTVASEEYRSAWLKNLAICQERKLFGDLTVEEREAFTFLTTNTPNVVPTVIENRIIELIESQSPLYADATKSGLAQGFSVPRHKSIDAGDAKETAEGKANDDEKDTFDFLTLDGIEIKKNVVISRKMKFKSIKAFEDWIVSHIAERIAVAKDLIIIKRLDNTQYGIEAGNVLTAQKYDDKSIRGILAKIRTAGIKAVYANANTIYNGLAGIKDGNGRPLFLDSTVNDDPLVKGRIYGAIVKEDNNLADNVAYFGVPSAILANDYDDLTMNHAMDPKTFEDIIAGYSLFDAGLENPKAFVKATFTGE